MKYLKFLTLFFFLSHLAFADWQASWIGAANTPAEKNNPEANQWICYRKKVALPKSVSNALAKISADSKYWLWINGTRDVLAGLECG